MSATRTEEIIAKINSTFFFKEFTFSKNDFQDCNSKNKLEFADNVVWLDDYLFIYQIKDREAGEVDIEKWFSNKIRKKAVQQIKSTLKYLNSHDEIIIQNECGHKLDIVKAKNVPSIRKIIVYTSISEFPQSIRNERFYESSQVGLIHIFHSEDYYWICEYLKTPSEIDEYLEFREQYFLANMKRSKMLPEQYFLAHFLETTVTDHYEPKYIDNLQKVSRDFSNFDISFIIENFGKNLLLQNGTDYYHIVKELSKLNRTELIEFKSRWLLTTKNCDLAEMMMPYRIHATRTDCSFVFISMRQADSIHWRNALQNFTLGHKYLSKAQKGIGVVMFRSTVETEMFEVYWLYDDVPWVHDEQWEELVKTIPLRDTNTKTVDNRYR